MTSSFRTLLLVAAAGAMAQTPNIPRSEHPNPMMARAEWQTLNGAWEFEFDDQNKGVAERWYAGDRKFSRTIQVPYAFQSKLSGIGDPSFHDVVWYRRGLRIPGSFAGKRALLNFGAVDYEATVWVNGQQAAWHRGGNVGFSCDITDFLKSGENVIVVRAFDPSTDRLRRFARDVRLPLVIGHVLPPQVLSQAGPVAGVG